MDNRTEVRDFLASRRARISPDQAGLISYGARRVPGLRQAEVAQLAGVSIEYYTRLERGNLLGLSEAVFGLAGRGAALDELRAELPNPSTTTRTNRASGLGMSAVPAAGNPSRCSRVGKTTSRAPASRSI
jgi:hypothetical protein